MARRLIPALCCTLALSFLAASAAAETRGLEVTLRANEKTDALVAETVELYAKSYALVIGIDRYTGGWPSLSNAVRDARRVAAELEERGFEVRLEADLSADELDEALESFFIEKGAEPEARLFVWFAGHGHTERGEGYLVPADAPVPQAGTQFRRKALSIRRFGEYVREARSKHVLAIFDSCFSGTIFDSARSLPPPAVTRATTYPVRQFLTSGDADQQVSDDGTFRKLFLRALAGEDRADANGDGYLTASELGLYLSDRMTNFSRGAQTPRYGKLRDPDYDRGDFVFAITLAQPAAEVKTPAPAPGAETAEPAAKGFDARQMELAFWQSIKDSKDPADFEAYLRKYRDGTFTDLAGNRLRQLRSGAGDGGVAAKRVGAGNDRKEEKSDQGETATAMAVSPQPFVRSPTSPAEPVVEPLNARLVATKNTNVRAGPSTSEAVIAKLPAGTRVTVTGKVAGADWYRIAYRGVGYVYAPLLSAEREALPPRHLSYRATYDLSLPPSAAGGGIEYLEGESVVSHRVTCEGYETVTETEFDVEVPSGGSQNFAATTSQYESLDGTAYAFSYKSAVNGRVDVDLAGRAQLQGPGGPGQITYSRPSRWSEPLPAGTIFPTAFDQTLTETARASGRSVEALVFMNNSGLIKARAVIAPSGPGQMTGVHVPVALRGQRSWIMRIEHSKPSGFTPIVSIMSQTYENGVSGLAILDQEGIRFRLTLDELETLPRPRC